MVSHIPELDELLSKMRSFQKTLDASPVKLILCPDCMKAGYPVNLEKSGEKDSKRYCGPCQEWVAPLIATVPRKLARKLGIKK